MLYVPGTMGLNNDFYLSAILYFPTLIIWSQIQDGA